MTDIINNRHIVTNRWMALPVFALVMFVVYYLSVTTVDGFLYLLFRPHREKGMLME